jgi:hypothetical protein
VQGRREVNWFEKLPGGQTAVGEFQSFASAFKAGPQAELDARREEMTVLAASPLRGAEIIN